VELGYQGEMSTDHVSLSSLLQGLVLGLPSLCKYQRL